MNKPTDAEIDAVLCNHWPAFSMQATLVRMWLRDAMRASLDKWGQPAHSGEPVAFIYWPINGPPRLAWYSQKALNDAILKTHKGYQPDVELYTAQPVERELLCSTELESYSDAYADTPEEAVAFRDGWRLAEQHYGIKKGGQHD